MNSLLWIVPLSLGLVGVALWGFFWAVEARQFDDLDSPGWSILDDDRTPSAALPRLNTALPPVDLAVPDSTETTETP